MIRGAAILLLILTAAIASLPATQLARSSLVAAANNSPTSPAVDPAGSPNAFNYTYSQANLYTASNATQAVIPASFPASNRTGISLTWLSTVIRTTNNTAIPGSGFRFNVTKANLVPAKQEVNWTLTIPQFNCKGCNGVSVNFNFFGSLTKGTNATYTLLNATNVLYTGTPGGSSLSCSANFCLNATRYIGFTLTLMFSFGWDATEVPGMHVDVGELVVAAIGGAQPSLSNTIQQDPTNSTRIIHTTSFSMIAYNNTLKTTLHPGGDVTKNWWHMEIIDIFYPAGSTVTKVTVNSTRTIFPAPPEVPQEFDHCFFGSPTCALSLLAFNFTDFFGTAIRGSNMTITSTTINAISRVTPVSGGSPSNVFALGDKITVWVTVIPSITNVSATQQMGSLNLTFFDRSGQLRSLPGQTIPQTATGGLYNFTLPSDCSNNSCGPWTINAYFASGFDLGNRTSSFTIDQMQVKTFSTAAGGNTVSVNGTLSYLYASSTTPVGVPVTIFAVDSGTHSNLPLPPTTNSSNGSGLYVSSATLVNGVFTQGQSLIMIFTITNPSNQLLNGTLRIDHEWPGSPPQTHVAFTNFTIGAANDGLGDLPIATGNQTYQATITITASAIEVALANARTPQNSLTKTMSPGITPIVSTEQHAGLFKITVASRSQSILVTSSLESPPYAYVPSGSVLGIPLAQSRYLAHSKTVSTDTNGGFSATIDSTSTLAAKRLVLFALGRDAAGVVVQNNGNSPGFIDSTVLQSSMDSIGQVAEGQTVTATLHLTNNSTSITAIITVNLNLQGSSGPVASQTGVSISPGQTKDVPLSFKAPSSPGQYLLTFSSPQYQNDVPLAGQTLQVIILQSTLQILIPAAIGIVVAIIVLGAYLIRKGPEKGDEEVTKTKPTSPKPKPTGAGSPPSKSLTRTEGLDR